GPRRPARRHRRGWGGVRRARHRAGQEGVPGRARGPGQALPDALDQGGVRSRRHTQPREGLRLMNGGQSLVQTLVDSGVDVCFMNPGTSEMHFVAALDSVPAMRGVLALFEGVATGAADGFGRMAGRPAATLLHLGPGLGNGAANLHNARRARTPVVNIVGDHATYHKKYDAQLESDVEGAARNVSPGFVRWATAPETVGRDAADTVAAAFGPPGQVATLVLPADVSWDDGGQVAPAPSRATPSPVPAERIDEVARALHSGEPAALLLGNTAFSREALEPAAVVS